MPSTQPEDKKKLTFTDKMRHGFRWLLDPIVAFLNRLGLRPNTVTLFGLVGTAAGAVLIAFGQMTWAGLIRTPFEPRRKTHGRICGTRKNFTMPCSRWFYSRKRNFGGYLTKLPGGSIRSLWTAEFSRPR